MSQLTSTPIPIDVPAALAAARDRVAPAPMPRVALRAAMRSSPLLHRLRPGRLDVLVGELRGRIVWQRDREAREDARATMRAILAGTAREVELESLARRHVIETEANMALFWQPPRDARTDARSSAHLQSALASGRGVLLSCCHVGPWFDLATPVELNGRRVYPVYGDWFFEAPTPNPWGRRLVHWQRKSATRKLERVIPASRSFVVIRDLLEAEEVVQSFFDMPGPHVTNFLGKPVMLADGTARLAIDADAMVLPARSRRVGHRSYVDFAAPLDARDFDDADQLHERLAAIHSQLILEVAETLEDPRRDGAWETGATAEAWISPRHNAAPTEPAIQAWA
jgi:lauroyl/myristoyl acyltransferase